MNRPSKSRRKELWIDLITIFVISFIVLTVYIMNQDKINDIASDSSRNILLRTLLGGAVFQFGLAGLGISLVTLVRRDNFRGHGLRSQQLLPALGLSLLCCLPDYLFQLHSGTLKPWLPFQDVHFTREVLSSGFPTNAIGMLIIAVCWGFFEGFNYVIISDKINELFPTKHHILDWGALFCAIMCILIHGAVGVTASALIDMLCAMILIYGMLVVRKITDNAWGCVLIFFVYWNAM